MQKKINKFLRLCHKCIKYYYKINDKKIKQKKSSTELEENLINKLYLNI